jgi:hydrogenase nickel incorporation protein HypB
MLFREAKAIILNKTDLIPYTNFNKQNFIKDLRNINGSVPLLEVSCTKGDGLDDWYKWIEGQMEISHDKFCLTSIE